jgi:uncharacterized protein
MIAVAAHPLGAVVPVRAQPGAKRTAVLGIRNGSLHVAVTAAPERGKANEAIIVVLAELLWCRKSTISLLSGLTSREKVFLIEGVTVELVLARIEDAIGSPGSQRRSK